MIKMDEETLKDFLIDFVAYCVDNMDGEEITYDEDVAEAASQYLEDRGDLLASMADSPVEESF